MKKLTRSEYDYFKRRTKPVALAYKTLSDIETIPKPIRDKLFLRYLNVDNCANVLKFKVYENGDRSLHQAYFCKDKFCPLCAEISFRSNYYKLSESMRWLDQYYRGLYGCRPSYIFGTLTVKNCSGSELASTVSKLSKDWAILKKRLERLTSAEDPIHRYSGPLFLGFHCVLEVTYKYKIEDNVRKLWFHPHLHFIALAAHTYTFAYTTKDRNRVYVNQGKFLFNGNHQKLLDNPSVYPTLSDMWYNISGSYITSLELVQDGFKSTYCRYHGSWVLKNSDNYFLKRRWGLSLELTKQSKYDLQKTMIDDEKIAKYTSKGISKLYNLQKDPYPLYYLSEALHGIRVFRSSGLFKTAIERYKELSDVDAANAFEPSELHDATYQIVTYIWNVNKRFYEVVDPDEN